MMSQKEGDKERRRVVYNKKKRQGRNRQETCSKASGAEKKGKEEKDDGRRSTPCVSGKSSAPPALMDWPATSILKEGAKPIVMNEASG